MKKVWILLALVLVTVGGLCLGIYRKDTSYDRIVGSISLNEAMKIAEANPACFLVCFSDGATGPQYQIAFGDYAGSDIEILGESTPARNLGGVFTYADNRFLVYAADTANRSALGKQNLDTAEECFTVYAEKWIPIYPIKRQYQFRDYQTDDFDSRLFAPKDCIDAFDLANGDYKP